MNMAKVTAGNPQKRGQHGGGYYADHKDKTLTNNDWARMYPGVEGNSGQPHKDMFVMGNDGDGKGDQPGPVSDKLLKPKKWWPY